VHYRQIQPAAPLARFVECFWILEGEGAPAARPEAIFPDGSSELILNFGEPFRQVCPDGSREPQPRSFLAGQLRGPLWVEPPARAGVFGVRFRPGGAPAFFPLPQHELAGRILALDVLWARSAAREVEEINVDAGGGRVEAVERFLLAALRRGPPPDPVVEAAIESILSAGGALPVESLAAGIGISARHLERRFRERVGLGAKLFSRIIRFQGVWQAIRRGDHDRWISIALDGGYYDQAHFIREFKEFSGETPSSYVSRSHERKLAELFARQNRPASRFFTIPRSRGAATVGRG